MVWPTLSKPKLRRPIAKIVLAVLDLMGLLSAWVLMVATGVQPTPPPPPPLPLAIQVQLQVQVQVPRWSVPFLAPESQLQSMQRALTQRASITVQQP